MTDRVVYGKVLSFFTTEFMEASYVMAHVQLFKEVAYDEYGLAYSEGKFRFEGGRIIHAAAFETLVGAVYNSAMRWTYILDRGCTVNGLATGAFTG